jgi:hypothetical protein
MAEESMIPDLVERRRLAFEAANRRDIDGVMSFFAHDADIASRAASISAAARSRRSSST